MTARTRTKNETRPETGSDAPQTGARTQPDKPSTGFWKRLQTGVWRVGTPHHVSGTDVMWIGLAVSLMVLFLPFMEGILHVVWMWVLFAFALVDIAALILAIFDV